MEALTLAPAPTRPHDPAADLTKREHVAAAALAALITAAPHNGGSRSPVHLADRAVAYADALVAALDATPRPR